MKTGKILPLGDLYADTWQKIYETTLTEAVTSLTISSLNGDVDEEYLLVHRIVSGANSCNNLLYLNNDSGSNYGRQMIYGDSTEIGAYRGTAETQWYLTNTLSLDTKSYGEMILYAKSGYVRTGIQLDMRIGSPDIRFLGLVWNNTTNNITSLVITASQTNGLGVGTIIELYRKIKKV